jgi:CheY-like chemotaxis protein
MDMSAAAENRQARRRVLIAEDDPITCELFSNLLGGFDGVEIVSVADGREALMQALTEHFDLILTDQNLPELAGDKLFRHLRASRNINSDTRMMLLSASSLDELESQGVHIPRECYMSKPVQPRTFLEAVTPFLE